MLIGALLDDLNERHQYNVTGIEGAAMEALRGHDWPGNVRELRNVLERAVILARTGEINICHLPKELASPPVDNRVQRQLGMTPSVTFPVGTSLDTAERELIEITLLHTRHNQTRAAEILGISPKTLYNKLREYGSAIQEE
jgi:DNA-binding NtrC family response regulator